MTRLKDGELNTVTMPSVSKGVYLVRVVDEGKVTMDKVVILSKESGLRSVLLRPPVHKESTTVPKSGRE